MEKQSDIDEAINYVNAWDENTDKLLVENEDFKRQIFLLTKKCQLNNNSEIQTRQEINQLHKIVTTLQTTMESQLQILDDYEQKKHEIVKLNAEINSLRAKCKHQEAEVKDQLEALDKLNKKECASLKEEYFEKLNEVRSSMQNMMEEKEKKILALKEVNSKLLKDKQNELLKMRLEYEAKLQKLQQQQVAAEPQQIHSSGSSMVRNDILRRKLHHVQVESQQEIDALKKKIYDLEKVVENRNSHKKRKLSFQ